jgi:hypothetical protein
MTLRPTIQVVLVDPPTNWEPMTEAYIAQGDTVILHCH